MIRCDRVGGMDEKNEQTVTYELSITMPKSLSDKLVQLSEQAGEDDECVYIVDKLVIKSINRRKLKK